RCTFTFFLKIATSAQDKKPKENKLKIALKIGNIVTSNLSKSSTPGSLSNAVMVPIRTRVIITIIGLYLRSVTLFFGFISSYLSVIIISILSYKRDNQLK